MFRTFKNRASYVLQVRRDFVQFLLEMSRIRQRACQNKRAFECFGFHIVESILFRYTISFRRVPKRTPIASHNNFQNVNITPIVNEIITIDDLKYIYIKKNYVCYNCHTARIRKQFLYYVTPKIFVCF